MTKTDPKEIFIEFEFDTDEGIYEICVWKNKRWIAGLKDPILSTK